MIRLIKQVFIELSCFSRSLASMVNVSNFTTYMSFNNQPCMTRPTLIYLNPDEYDQGLRCYWFMVNLDRLNGSCHIFDDPSDKIWVPSKTAKQKI